MSNNLQTQLELPPNRYRVFKVLDSEYVTWQEYAAVVPITMETNTHVVRLLEHLFNVLEKSEFTCDTLSEAREVVSFLAKSKLECNEIYNVEYTKEYDAQWQS